MIIMPGQVAWSNAHPPGIQTVPGSILQYGKTLFLEIGHEIISMAILSPLLI